MGVRPVFEHADESIRRLKKKDVIDAEVLVNSAKRSSAYDIDTPVRLLGEADDLAYMVNRDNESVRLLEKYRAEVNREVKRCRHEEPHFSWRVALVPIRSECEVQGLIAETWKRQLDNYLVLVANFGYIGDKVAYAIRTQMDTSVIDFMESLKPGDYPHHVAWGHDRAAGGVVSMEVWQHLAERMGFRAKE
jgi:hypothetical protein